MLGVRDPCGSPVWLPRPLGKFRERRERMRLLSLCPAFICSCHALGKPGQVENKSDSLKLRGSLTPFPLLKRQLPPLLPSH